MFWNSVITGLKVMTFWETYIAGFMYLAIFVIPTLVIGIMIRNGWFGKTRIGSHMGCLSIFFLPILQVTALAIFIVTISPIIFGFSKDAAWNLPWEIIYFKPIPTFLFIGFLFLTSILIELVPILGRLHSFKTLILSGIVIIFVIGIIDASNPDLIRNEISFLPDFWFSMGLIVIGGIVQSLGILAASLIAIVIEMSKEGIGDLLMFPIGAIFGFIPLFMYGTWIGLQIIK